MGLNGVGGVAATPSDRFTGLATEMVLKNLVVFGTVNANRRHYYRGRPRCLPPRIRIGWGSS